MRLSMTPSLPLRCSTLVQHRSHRWDVWANEVEVRSASCVWSTAGHAEANERRGKLDQTQQAVRWSWARVSVCTVQLIDLRERST